MRSKLIAILFFLYAGTNAQTGWMAVSTFGTNPGNLKMYAYVPAGIGGAAPLVVAMHGCTQNASLYAAETGWNKLADQYKFYVVYAEQQAANNSSYCFNWFQSGNQDRNQGEALSIKEMVDYMKSSYIIDSSRVYVTGLSAGGCMTSVMLACYPDVFSKGAIMAGVPYKSATNASQVNAVTSGFVSDTPQAWGALVTGAYPGYTGPYPDVAIFHGTMDNVVSFVNLGELMKQWTNVNNADQTADVSTSSFNGNSFVKRNVYADGTGAHVVETYTLSGMGHGIALDTGQCWQQCGETGAAAFQFYFSSTFFAAYFFGITSSPYVISGPASVAANASGVSYGVPNASGSSYTWVVPAGASVAGGQGTSQATVSFSTASGFVEVTETLSNNCKLGPAKLFVNVGGVGVGEAPDQEFAVFSAGSSLLIQGREDEEVQLSIFSAVGKLMYEEKCVTNRLVRVELAEGIYIAVMRTKSRTLARKVIIGG